MRQRIRRVHTALCHIPIIDASLRIVGWTDTVPSVLGSGLRHPEAESLVGGPIDALYIEIRDKDSAVAAGAATNWKGPWRCLALAEQGAAQRLGQGAALAEVVNWS